jgi:rSAM/selenodomain-associated transferase 2
MPLRLSNEKISIVIPVLNEASQIQTCLSTLQQSPDVEVIVVDGGSCDETVDRATACGVYVIESLPGRSLQMNRGAETATGDILLFLHVDTQLPHQFVSAIPQTLGQPNVVAGAFELQIGGTLAGLRWVEWGVKWRSHLFQLPYGDQAIFMRATTFQQIGGFPELPIMEDFELVRRLKQLGRVAIAPYPVTTSARRWEKLGVLKTTLLNQLMIIAYLLGVSSDRLVRWYKGGSPGRKVKRDV